MKKITTIIFVFVICIISKHLNSQYSLRMTTGPHILVHPERSITFGSGTANTNNGRYSIEHWNGGLNFWKAFPTAGYGNGKMLLHDNGMLGINIGTMNLGQGNQNGFFLLMLGKAASNGWFTISDSSMKGNVTSLTNSLQKVLQMRPVSYVYKSRKFAGQDIIPDSLIPEGDSIKRMTVNGENERLNALPEFETQNHYGFIAQELKRVCPDVVAEIGTTEGVNLPEIVPLLVHSIQIEHKSKDSLKEELDSLKTLVQNLRQEIINWQGRSIDTIGQSKSRLFQNNPNPFDGNTTITYFIDENVAVTSAIIEVRNIMGTLQSTITLNDGTGLGNTQYNGSNLSPGYYIYTLKINGSVKDSKMFLKEL